MEKWTPLAILFLGIVQQWIRGFQKIPTWIVDVGSFVIAVVLYFMGCGCKFTWTPEFFISAGGFIYLLFTAQKGTGSYAKNTPVAPATNSL